MKGVMNPADQLPIFHRVMVVLLVTVATVKPCEMHKRQYRLVAESEILAAKCLGENFLSEIKVRPALHNRLHMIGQSSFGYTVHTDSIFGIINTTQKWVENDKKVKIRQQLERCNDVGK